MTSTLLAVNLQRVGLAERYKAESWSAEVTSPHIL